MEANVAKPFDSPVDITLNDTILVAETPSDVIPSDAEYLSAMYGMVCGVKNTGNFIPLESTVNAAVVGAVPIPNLPVIWSPAFNTAVPPWVIVPAVVPKFAEIVPPVDTEPPFKPVPATTIVPLISFAGTPD